VANTITLLLLSAITVKFRKSVYLMDINRKGVQLTIDLINSLSFDITIQVKIVDNNVTGRSKTNIC